MIEEFVKIWEESKEELRESFLESEPSSYNDIVKRVIELIHAGHGDPDPTNIHVIDDGDYQGTLLFIIPAEGYQPSRYWAYKCYYGSCGGCDTFQSIRDDCGTLEGRIDDYMTLALHVIQGLKEV
jgi:hypothetical protein